MICRCYGGWVRLPCGRCVGPVLVALTPLVPEAVHAKEKGLRLLGPCGDVSEVQLQDGVLPRGPLPGKALAVASGPAGTAPACDRRRPGWTAGAMHPVGLEP